MPTALRQQKYPFGSLRTDPHWSVEKLQLASVFQPSGALVDMTTHKNDGTLVGPPVWVGQGLDFDRTTPDYVQVPSNINITGPPFTVIVWFKCDVLPSTTGDEYSIFSHNNQDAGADLGWWRCRIDDADDKLHYGARQGTFDASAEATSAIAITAGKWHQMAAVEVADDLRHIYLDAGNRGTATGSDPPSAPATHVFDIGYNEAGAQDAFLGQIAEVLVYGRVLSASEIQELNRNPDLPFQQYPAWIGQAAVAVAGLSGIYYRTLLQGVS